jgi:hypothetical protein
MPDFNIRSESIDVEQIMDQIRARIREKRGVDYTEQQIRELAAVKLEKLLDPRGVRSDLLERFRQVQAGDESAELPNYAFDETTLYETHRAPIRWIRRILQPVLKLFFNPNPLIQALNIQARLNTAFVQREVARRALDQLSFEVIHNLVVETTRLGIEVKNLKMRVESLASRLDFNERRARALESAVVYKPSGELGEAATPAAGTSRTGPAASGPPVAYPAAGATSAPQTAGGGWSAEGPGLRSRRRRRRRGRRGGGPSPMEGGAPETQPQPSSMDDAGHEGFETQTETLESEGTSLPTESGPGASQRDAAAATSDDSSESGSARTEPHQQ